MLGCLASGLVTGRGPLTRPSPERGPGVLSGPLVSSRPPNLNPNLIGTWGLVGVVMRRHRPARLGREQRPGRAQVGGTPGSQPEVQGAEGTGGEAPLSVQRTTLLAGRDREAEKPQAAEKNGGSSPPGVAEGTEGAEGTPAPPHPAWAEQNTRGW